ncbi:hypothetical protein HOLDEFILI_02213 [Holdemania filiformis DSM 12042]|jgi:hypothetical protein|uniref:Uncharacterized protein n=1 Tax=Holdemania filiformis DSM 12042 TaxID=545696 RepID=B9Y8R5_9FIRM|nr:hypothetical protein HOLDEFILI_02213 [Holdemania filiformis DSM 12042]
MSAFSFAAGFAIMISIHGIEETEGSVVDKFLIVTLALDLSEFIAHSDHSGWK